MPKPTAGTRHGVHLSKPMSVKCMCRY